jgi:hypothetical protein
LNPSGNVAGDIVVGRICAFLQEKNTKSIIARIYFFILLIYFFEWNFYTAESEVYGSKGTYELINGVCIICW